MTAAERFESEARSRVIWGDSPEDIIAHLQNNEGATLPEAQAAYESVKNDRNEFIKSAGKKKIIIGILMMLVPVVTFVIFMAIRVYSLKVLAFTIAIGLIGVWRLIRGILGIVRPQAIHGDLSDEDTE